MLRLRKNLFAVLLSAAVMLTAGAAMADTSVSWITPPDGSTYYQGTVLGTLQPDGAITGRAGAGGGTGGTGLDLMLVIDTSASMKTDDKIGYAKAAAIALINALPDHTTRIGIVNFDEGADTPRILQDLTANKDALISAVNELDATGYWTAIGDGIEAATAELIGDNAIPGHAKMQIVLSDGKNNLGADPIVAATDAAGQNITIHSVGVPMHYGPTMEGIAAATGGVYTNVTDLGSLVGLFDGTGGNLVGLDHVDILLADGTMIYDISTDGLGNFILPDQVIALGANTFTAYAYGTDGTSATAELTLNGVADSQPVPEPATILLLGVGLAGLGVASRRKNKK